VQSLDLLGDEWDEWPGPRPPAYDWKWSAVGRRLGGEHLGASLYELPPGARTFPYHYHSGNEEWLLVVDGKPTLRAPGGERELAPGDVVCFPRGPEGAHQLSNRSEHPVRVLLLSTLVTPDVVEYLDSGKVGARSAHGRWIFKSGTEVDYWEGE
jgi:uncharacterized cupin superfamily protein